MKFLKWYTAILTTYTALYGLIEYEMWVSLIWGAAAYFCWTIALNKDI